MAGKAQAEELFWLVAAIPWGGAAYQGDEAVGMPRRCTDGSRPCEDILGGMDATAVASWGSDKSRLPAEHYFEEVLQGARLIESQCSKDVMFK